LLFGRPVRFPIFEHYLHIVFDRVLDARHGSCAVEILAEVAGIDRCKPCRRLVQSFLSDDRAAECDADLKRPALAHAAAPACPLRFCHEEHIENTNAAESTIVPAPVEGFAACRTFDACLIFPAVSGPICGPRCLGCLPTIQSQSQSWDLVSSSRRRLRADKLPRLFELCLPRPAKDPPAGPGWIHEIKHDGFRILAHRQGPVVRLITRNGHDLADRFPLAAAAITALPVKSCVVDGEAIVCDDNGLAVFDLIRGHGRNARAILCAFDLLELDGKDLRRAPLEERKHTLANLLFRERNGIVFNQHYDGSGEIVFKRACALGCEGNGLARHTGPGDRGTGSRSRTRRRQRCGGSKKKKIEPDGRSPLPAALDCRRNRSLLVCFRA
jgi:bifunctional non-homologous end joining protein LigD